MMKSSSSEAAMRSAAGGSVKRLSSVRSLIQSRSEASQFTRTPMIATMTPVATHTQNRVLPVCMGVPSASFPALDHGDVQREEDGREAREEDDVLRRDHAASKLVEARAEAERVRQRVERIRHEDVEQHVAHQ